MRTCVSIRSRCATRLERIDIPLALKGVNYFLRRLIEVRRHPNLTLQVARSARPGRASIWQEVQVRFALSRDDHFLTLPGQFAELAELRFSLAYVDLHGAPGKIS